MTSEGSANARRLMLRRIPLLVVAGVAAWLFYGERPLEVELVYDLQSDPAPLRVQVVIRTPDGSTTAAIAWGNGKQPAPNRQLHRVRLAPGLHRLSAVLEYADGERTDVLRDLTATSADERIVVHLF